MLAQALHRCRRSGNFVHAKQLLDMNRSILIMYAVFSRHVLRAGACTSNSNKVVITFPSLIVHIAKGFTLSTPIFKLEKKEVLKYMQSKVRSTK